MIQGETTTFTLSFPFDMEDKEVNIVFGQRDKEILTLSTQQLEIGENIVTVTLPNVRTSELLTTAPLQIQAVITDNNTVLKSLIAEEPVYKAVQP